MNFPTESRRLLIPAAWLATAVLTFCIGRMSSFIDAPVVGAMPATLPAERSASGVDARTFATPISRGEGGTFASPLEELTAGRAIGKWLKNLLNEEDEIARMNGFMRLMDVLGTGDELTQALDAVMANGNGWSRGKEFSMLLQKWAQLDPVQAMAWVGKIKDQDTKYSGSRAVLSTWTRRSPQEAIAWAGKNGVNTNAQEGNWAMATVVSQLAKSDPDWALQVMQTQNLSTARGRMIDSVIGQFFSQRGEVAAREMVMGIPEETLRHGAMGRLTRRLTANDPQSAAQWIATLPASEGRQRALTELVSQWSENDPAAAATYLSKYPASPETDESRARLAQNVLRKDPEGALAWAGTISEEQSRTRAVTELVRGWMRRDADAAQKWVQASQLPDDVRARLGLPGAGGGRQ